MKTYGFIFADEMEYKPFHDLALEQGGLEIKDKPLPAVSLSLGDSRIVAVHSGIGKVNAAIAASLLIYEFQVDALLNAGLSGAISQLKKGDVVAGESYVECDFDLRVFGYALGQKSDGTYVHEAGDELLAAAQKIEGMKTGALGTGDFFLNDSDRKEAYKGEFHINAFDMETAAIADVADTYGIPFLSVRKISDDADDTADESYTALNELAEEDLSKILLEIVEKLN